MTSSACRGVCSGLFALQKVKVIGQGHLTFYFGIPSILLSFPRQPLQKVKILEFWHFWPTFGAAFTPQLGRCVESFAQFWNYRTLSLLEPRIGPLTPYVFDILVLKLCRSGQRPKMSRKSAVPKREPLKFTSDKTTKLTVHRNVLNYTANQQPIFYCHCMTGFTNSH